MRTFVRSAVAFAAIALFFAAGNAMAVTVQLASASNAPTQLHALDLPKGCKNPAECGIK
jgi:hypothetical protein